MPDTLVDKKAVFTLISTIRTNRDRLRQGIDGLRPIHNRWKDSHGSSINLIAQLTSLKSTLGKIQDWLSYAVQELHPQLLSDLDVLMASCGLLVRHVDALVRRLEQSDRDAVDLAVKLSYAVASRSMDRLQQVAQRQNEAVTLLLAACECSAQAQRKILLHKSRQIRKEHASSIQTLARSSRWNNACITVLTQLSRLIQWFRLLFQFKLSGDRLDADLPPTAEEYEFAAAATRSEAIDRALQEEATMLRRETKIVLLGNISSGKELIMHQMKSLYAEGFYPEQERMNYRPSVYSVVRRLIQSIIHLLRDTGVTLSSELNHDFAILLHEVETADPQHITPEAVKAVESIWACPRFSKLFIRNSEIEFPQYAPYFARAVARVAEVDYVPSEADIIRLNQSMRGIKELRFSWDELDVHLFNISGYVPQHFRERWYHQLEGATSLIYTIDICLYDKPNPAQPSKSLLETEFASFENWVNEPRFANSSIILLLNNFTRFCKKLHYSPLGSLCSDYTPSESDPEMSARQYLLRRFKGVNHQALSIYSFWVDLDMSDNQHLYAALKKTLTNIQQHKAREKVRNASGTTVDSNRHSANGLSNLSGASRDTLRNKKSIQSEEFV